MKLLAAIAAFSVALSSAAFSAEVLTEAQAQDYLAWKGYSDVTVDSKNALITGIASRMNRVLSGTYDGNTGMVNFQRNGNVLSRDLTKSIEHWENSTSPYAK